MGESERERRQADGTRKHFTRLIFVSAAAATTIVCVARVRSILKRVQHLAAAVGDIRRTTRTGRARGTRRLDVDRDGTTMYLVYSIPAGPRHRPSSGTRTIHTECIILSAAYGDKDVAQFDTAAASRVVRATGVRPAHFRPKPDWNSTVSVGF